MTFPKLALTMGDTSGIGPEITAKWLARRAKAVPRDYSVCVIGDIETLTDTAKRLSIHLPEASADFEYQHIDAPSIGETSYQAIQRTAQGCLDETFAAMVTGPISKAQLNAAGLPASGHTEILDAIAKAHSPESHAEMLFLYKNFRIMLLTRHIPLTNVSQALSIEGVHGSLSRLHGFLHQHLQSSPRIAVMGCNPHAGEIGGREETDILAPAIASLNASLETKAIHGPFSADALLRSLDPEKPAYDAYVACTHDQGLIPMKLLAGLHAVNVTIGLPFIRTSVSHGTAEDIAGLGIADETSLVVAAETAFALSTRHTVPLASQETLLR